MYLLIRWLLDVRRWMRARVVLLRSFLPTRDHDGRRKVFVDASAWSFDSAARTFRHRSGLTLNVEMGTKGGPRARALEVPVSMDQATVYRLIVIALLIAVEQESIGRQWERCHAACDELEAE
jgi:hypothetical protein